MGELGVGAVIGLADDWGGEGGNEDALEWDSLVGLDWLVMVVRGTGF